MGSPFTTAGRAAVECATEPQLAFITTLLEQRNWKDEAAVSAPYIERAAAIKVSLSLLVEPEAAVFDMTAGASELGEALNILLAQVSSTSQRPDTWKPFTKTGATAFITWLKGLPVTAAQPTERTIPATAADVRAGWWVPAGRYAIDTQVHAVNGTAFYRVDRPTEGKWAGRVFVKQIIAPDEQRLSQKQGGAIIKAIAAVGAEAASARYGHEIGECGMCGRRLTNDESRARGIGPVCAAKAGW